MDDVMVFKIAQGGNLPGRDRSAAAGWISCMDDVMMFKIAQGGNLPGRDDPPWKIQMPADDPSYIHPYSDVQKSPRGEIFQGS